MNPYAAIEADAPTAPMHLDLPTAVLRRSAPLPVTLTVELAKLRPELDEIARQFGDLRAALDATADRINTLLAAFRDVA